MPHPEYTWILHSNNSQLKKPPNLLLPEINVNLS